MTKQLIFLHVKSPKTKTITKHYNCSYHRLDLTNHCFGSHYELCTGCYSSYSVSVTHFACITHHSVSVDLKKLKTNPVSLPVWPIRPSCLFCVLPYRAFVAIIPAKQMIIRFRIKFNIYTSFSVVIDGKII